MDTTTNLRIAERFSRLTPEQRRAVYRKIHADGLGIGQFPIVPADSQARDTVSYAQARQWFLWQLDPRSTAYHIAGALTLEGDLDVAALRGSFDALVARHESLRTVFEADESGQARQVIRAPFTLDIPVIAVDDATAEAARVVNTPFDLTQGPLLRVVLLQRSEREHVLVVVMHHIVSDGWSMQVIVDEFVAGYRGDAASLPPLALQYADYAVWQRHWLEAGEKDRQLAYWTHELGGTQPVLQLPTDHPRRAGGVYRAARHVFELEPDLVKALQQRAQAEGATLFMVLLAGLQTLLHRYTGQEDIRIGVPIANRHRAETVGIVGFFVNTQVLRNELDGRTTLQAVLQRAKASALGAQAHQDLPFEQLVEALQPERSLGTTPLFQVLFNHQREARGGPLDLPGLVSTPHTVGERGAQFELSLETFEQADGRIHASFAHAAELFEAATIARLAGHYGAVLRAMALRPAQPVGEVVLSGDEELAQMQAWGDNATTHDQTLPVHALFEQQVTRQPNETAVVFEDRSLSYAELNRRANQVAHRLIALGVGPDTKVGIAAERSLEMVVGLLGILKAGGAYVPLDPEYPADRLAYMVADSGIALVLGSDLALGAEHFADQPEHDPAVKVHGEHLAYAIYTSGSTGKPKGVMVHHGALVHFLLDMAKRPGLVREDVVVAVTSLSFDIATLELYLPLLSGAKVVLAPRHVVRDGEALARLVDASGATVLQSTPSGWRLLLAGGWRGPRGRVFKGLCGGEALPPDLATSLTDLGVDLWNLYGPTETTVWSAAGRVREAAGLGGPIAGTRLHVLDAGLEPAPVGVGGELFIGGVGLARGYLNRPGLTAERFIADPFGGGGRLYRTGDLVRWNARGQLEYLGRIDHQVKVRGFRIELGEVEVQLLAQPAVREAVVVARDGATLVAYVVGEGVDPATVREGLGRSLPEHMVPGRVVVLERLPLTPNGKIDRKALPDPGAARDHEPPQGDVETALAAIWSDVLQVTTVGRDDNFFELGGHSILALRVVARARQRGLRLGLQDVVGQPTLRALGRATAAPAGRVVALNAPRPGVPPLFCIHPALGSVLGYLPLARALGGVRPVFGVPCRTLQDPLHRDTGLQAMADDYVAFVREVQPRGPYHLLGWSLGGALAVCMAATLEARGETVAFLGLVDPTVPSQHGTALAATPDWRGDFTGLLRDLDPALGGDVMVPPGLADPLDDETPLRDWTVALHAAGRFVPRGRFHDATPWDMVRTFLVDRCMTRLVRRDTQPLPKVSAPTTCWWANDQRPAVMDALVHELGTVRLASRRVDASHADIVHHEAFLTDPVWQPGGEAAGVPTPAAPSVQRDHARA